MTLVKGKDLAIRESIIMFWGGVIIKIRKNLEKKLV